METDTLEATKTHEPRNLSRDDVDSRACHEAADCRSWNKFHEPPQSEKADAKDDEATDEGDGRSYLRSIPGVRMGLIDMLYDLRYGEGHDRNRAYGDILRSCKELK